MYIKEGLVYNKHNGELIGYCDLGDVNNHLLQLENEYKNPTSLQHHQFASTMMVVMVRGLFNSFLFPYASFPASNLSGEQLVPIFYEAIMRVELCGLKVACITLDGNSVNRKFIKLIGQIKKNNISYKFKNPLSFNAREVFLFSDPPHLIKTARNCLANPKRNMQVINLTLKKSCMFIANCYLQLNGKSMSWEHIKQLYHTATETTGLSTVHKLKYEHIYLSGFSKMRVDYAAQVHQLNTI